MKGTFLPLNGYKYKYEISNTGKIVCLNPFHKKNKGKPMSSVSKHGYKVCTLIKNDGCAVTKKVHRLVAEYFLDDWDESLTVNHLDFDKTNNHVSNLEMVSSIENLNHYTLHKRKLKSSSNHIGVGFHKGIGKWTARFVKDYKRVSLGVYNSEIEAINAIKEFSEGKKDVHIGKGSQNKGKSKYSEEQNIEALLMAREIGVRKAGAVTGMGSTRISLLRKIYKMENGIFVKYEAFNR